MKCFEMNGCVLEKLKGVYAEIRFNLILIALSILLLKWNFLKKGSKGFSYIYMLGILQNLKKNLRCLCF